MLLWGQIQEYCMESLTNFWQTPTFFYKGMISALHCLAYLITLTAGPKYPGSLQKSLIHDNSVMLHQKEISMLQQR